MRMFFRHWLLALAMALSGLAVAGPAGAQSCNGRVDATAPDSRYIAHGDGTVTDRETGLMWRQCSEGQTWSNGACVGSASGFNWQGSLQRAVDVNAGAAGERHGYSDWRLPNRNELASLVERQCYDPAVNFSVFPGTVSSNYWSSSPNANYSSGAWVVGFDGGGVYGALKGNGGYVRLVRGGQSFGPLPPDCAGTPGGTATVDACGVCDSNPANDCQQDCAGTWGGTATVDNCNVCDSNPANDCTQDCAGTWGGTATTDNCGVCDTNPANDCTQDCAGTYGGTATRDNCNVCDTNPANDCTQDCARNWGGTATVDNCNVCDSNPTNDCVQDCAGAWGGTATVDNCNVCDSNPANDCVQDCAGAWGGTASADLCGFCLPANDPARDSSCASCVGVPNIVDCAGTPNGTATLDNCGICDANPANDCTQDCAGTWGGTATRDACNVCLPLNDPNRNKSCADCAGTPNGPAMLDNCGICDANPANDCAQDCSGNWGGSGQLSDRVLINEVHYDQDRGEQEFIELYAPAANQGPVNLNGWRLKDMDEMDFEFANLSCPQPFILNPGDRLTVWQGNGQAVCAGPAREIYMGVGTFLQRDGDDVALVNAVGNCVDYLAYELGWNQGSVIVPPPADCVWHGLNPGNGNTRGVSISRFDGEPIIDTDTGSDWEKSGESSTTGPFSPMAGNEAFATGGDGGTGGNGTGGGTVSASVLINEVHYDQDRGEQEFIELYAPAANSGPVNLNGWRLKDMDEMDFEFANLPCPQPFILNPGDRLTVWQGNGQAVCAGPAREIYMGVGTFLQRAGDDVALVNAVGNCVDYLAYELGWNQGNVIVPPPADCAWHGPNPGNGNTRGVSISRFDGEPIIDTDTGSDWEKSGESSTTGPKTPAAANE